MIKVILKEHEQEHGSVAEGPQDLNTDSNGAEGCKGQSLAL